MYSDSARRKRLLYHYARRHTSPAVGLEEEEEIILREKCLNVHKQPLIQDSGLSSSIDTDTDTNSELAEIDEDSDVGCLLQNKEAERASRRRRFSEERSRTVPAEIITLREAIAKKLEKERDRTQSAPSFLLSKVKERIERHILHSSDGPTSAAIFEDRRQRMLSACLDERSAQKTDEDQEGYDLVSREFTSTKGGKGISIRGHNCRQHYSFSAVPNLKQKDIESGVVCSNEDLRAILQVYRKPSLQYKRTQSLDERRESLFKQLSTHSAPCKIEGDSQGCSAGCSNATSTEDIMGHTDQIELLLENKLANCCSLGKIEHRRMQTDGGEFQESGLHTGDTEKQNEQKLAKVRDVTYDDDGLTWDIYGADFDVQILGDAIQRHLHVMSDKELQFEHDKSEESQNNGKRIRLRNLWQLLLCRRQRTRVT
ncbi:uncharacterized protein LOC106155568 [Lingula anatina]|uniref:Uncharacterized protein LOC106155568 n=1 Tax=Lingula anatina TaxID=7574 RepID=A0A1S3HIF4_LINAN|nr:uncharacterized protein LOC106155568 [Lingula anatina]XP_013385905.1 uncharacterized protein LOC106155568 [Lingula anatina]XP_013385906.1 uncharacterized protein LOC106155568 [Lingula anatina]XP_013385907.1 uncharacterized protein LOC106155568 [Lingula anatina]XP_013385908.1 uncharacterized protein LOC106155568 [Lingula anatina]XP_013385909.1 uncharacterized protein LOC106155568 [Lingula anatina]XP_013385910.1 uncharacterized protein LOC106155568 [Lingula anatina]|eukprot:XP_013385904.1 uncharacterized protein LOC106155568 [Lingula anatina]